MNRILYACIFCVLTCSPSYPATLSQAFNFNQAAEPFAIPIDLAQFDPAIGTLTDITFQIFGTQISSATVTDSSGLGTVTFVSSSDFFLSDLSDTFIFDEVLPSSEINANVTPGGSFSFSTAAQQRGTAFYSAANGSFFQLMSYDGNGSPTNPIDSTLFLGNGIFPLNFQAIDNSTANAGAQVIVQSATGGGTVSVTYNYTPSNVTPTPTPTPEPTPEPTPTPEPGTFELLGVAILALVAQRGSPTRRKI